MEMLFGLMSHKIQFLFIHLGREQNLQSSGTRLLAQSCFIWHPLSGTQILPGRPSLTISDVHLKVTCITWLVITDGTEIFMLLLMSLVTQYLFVRQLSLVPWKLLKHIWMRLPWKPCYSHSREKCLDILYRAEICAILTYFCLNLVAMASPFAPLKILIAYFNSTIPKTLTIHANNV